MKDRKQELRNNLDDAYLALLMDELCEEEGALLWEECEHLNEDPDAAVPESLHQKCMDAIKNHYARERKARRRSWGRAAVRKLLIAAAILAALFTTSFAAVEEFRVGVLNFSLGVQEKYSTLVFEEEEHTQSAGPPEQVPGEAIQFADGHLIVDFDLTGFEVLENVFDEIGAFVNLSADGNNQIIMIDSSRIVESMDFQVDTEDADKILEMELGDNKGYLIVENDRNYIVWADFQNNVVLQLTTYGLSEEYSMKLAESITYVGEKQD